MKLLATFLLSMCLVFLACGDDDQSDVAVDMECNSLEFSAEFEDNFNIISQSITNFTNHPSASNCDTLRSVFNEYIEKLEAWEYCAIALDQRAEWSAALNDARESVDLLC